MTITKELDNKQLTIRLDGELNTSTAPELESVLSSSLKGITLLIFDFAKLIYISSAGLRIVLSTQKQMNKQGRMIVRNCNEDVMDVFEMTGFSNILDFGD